MNPNEVQNQVIKAGSAWAAWSITTWADLASVMSFVAGLLAAIYSLILIWEALSKKFKRGRHGS